MIGGHVDEPGARLGGDVLGGEEGARTSEKAAEMVHRMAGDGAVEVGARIDRRFTAGTAFARKELALQCLALQCAARKDLNALHNVRWVHFGEFDCRQIPYGVRHSRDLSLEPVVELGKQFARDRKWRPAQAGATNAALASACSR